MRNSTKYVSIMLGLAFCLSVISAQTVSAADNYNVKGEHQPYFHGFNAQQLKDWSPTTDDTAKYFRSTVTLQPRNQPDVATQAQPTLQNNAQLLTLSGDYGDPGYGYEAGIPDFTRTVAAFSRNVFQFWQYVDYYASWNGTPIAGSDYEAIRANKNVTYGVVNYPNPAYTDAAHRNGVKSLGSWFWPRDETFSEWVEQTADGRFPVADKMIELAQYMNFDGYFINQEATISAQDAQHLQKMLVYLKHKAPQLYVQFYDSLTKEGQLHYVNGFDESNSYWVQAENGAAADSLFMNYAWNKQRLANGNQHAKTIGLDPLQVMYAGTENQKYGFNPPYDPRAVFANKREPLASWALFGSDFVYSRLPANNLKMSNQTLISQREREYWSGPRQNPTETGRLTDENSSPYPDEGVPNDANNAAHWDGVADFIAEKTVIEHEPFVSHFNTGHGTAFFANGEKVSENEWSNIGIQDILPSWQWWSTGKVSVAYDYSTAWDGGSSLRLQNKGGQTEVNVYKTDKIIKATDVLQVAAQTTGELATNITLYFKDTLKQPVNLPLKSTSKWQEQTIDLSPYQGRELGKISVTANTKTTGTINLGKLAVIAPTSMATEPAFSVAKWYQPTGEAFVKANMNKALAYYDVYDDNHHFIGRINTADSYLDKIPSLTQKLVVYPVSKQGERLKEIAISL